MTKEGLLGFASEAQELGRKHQAKYSVLINENSVDVTYMITLSKYIKGEKINNETVVKDLVQHKKRPGRPPKTKVVPIDKNKERDY